MLDKMLLRATKPAVEFVAGQLRRRGVSADQVTLTGFAGGVVAAGLIALGHPGLALWPLLFNRLCDGLDGAVARGSGASDRGAFLDISLDFIFYGLIPLAFALMDPAANGVYAALLLAAFIGTGSSFLAYAILAEKRGQKSTAYPGKGFYYLGGLTEGFETMLCFVLMCLFPAWFPELALFYAGLCAITILTRLVAGWQTFGR